MSVGFRWALEYRKYRNRRVSARSMRINNKRNPHEKFYNLPFWGEGMIAVEVVAVVSARNDRRHHLRSCGYLLDLLGCEPTGTRWCCRLFCIGVVLVGAIASAFALSFEEVPAYFFCLLLLALLVFDWETSCVRAGFSVV